MKYMLDDSFFPPPATECLRNLPAGRSARIQGLGRGRDFRARLLGMGIRPGVTVTVLRGAERGPKVVRIGRDELMIGGEILSDIFVCEDDQHENQ